MKSQLIIFSFLSFICLTIQGSVDSCKSVSSPSKEECNNIIPLDKECCFVTIGSSSYCEEYDLDLINSDSYIEDELKKNKTDLIIGYLFGLGEIPDDDTVKTSLHDMLQVTKKIECNSFTKEIDYSTITYSEDDISKAKQDNFCGKLGLSEGVNEEQCLNGIVFSDLATVGEKCCYYEIYSEKTEEKISSCLSLSKAQRENEKYLESLVSDIEETFTVKIICDGFNYEKRYPETEPTSNEECENFLNPSSKEQCNNINSLNSECCYIKLIYDSEEEKYCRLYDPEAINYENYVQDYLKDEKISLIIDYLDNLEDREISNDEIIEGLANMEDMKYKYNIECNSLSKEIDYSQIIYTKEDISIAKQDNFCGKLIDPKGNPSEDKCLDGIVFSELEAAGEKCCYVEFYYGNKDETVKQCISLSKTQRENFNYLKTLIRTENVSAKIICDGFHIEYDPSTEQWIDKNSPISDQNCEEIENPSKYQCNKINLLNSECCYIESVFDDGGLSKKCEEYDPKLANYEGYEQDELNLLKNLVIEDYFSKFKTNNDIPPDNTVLEELNKIIDNYNDYTKKIKCKTFTKEIDYSSIKYTQNDIEIAKNDNFCMKLSKNYNIENEGQCLNGLVLSNPNLDEKCCYVKLYSEGKYPVSGQCLSTTKFQRENLNSLVAFLPFIENNTYTIEIICEEFHKEYISSTGEWVDEIKKGEECENVLEPSKEQCNNINLLASECCYITEIFPGEENKHCEEMAIYLNNYDNYIEDSLKNYKMLIINNYLQLNDINNIDEDTILEELKEESNFKMNIECKTFSETIDYSKITYTKDDIEIAKKDNFCGKLMLSEEKVNEEQCLNGILLSDFAEAGGKCCYIEIYKEKTKEKISLCFSLSKEQMDNLDYKKSSFLPDDFDESYKAKIICDGLHLEYDSTNGLIKNVSSSSSSSTIECEDIKNPSKEQCNNINLLNSKCCYVESYFESGLIKKCGEYNNQSLFKINGYEESQLNSLKMDLITSNIQNEEIIVDYDSFISKIKSFIPNNETIYCNDIKKSLDYSKITISKDDIEKAQNNNFCPKLQNNINIDNCFNGVLFSDFVSAGGQCCYLDIIISGEKQNKKKCIPLSISERENNDLLELKLKKYKLIGQYTAIISCDGYKKKYESSTGSWMIVNDSDSYSFSIKINIMSLLLFILLILSNF